MNKNEIQILRNAVRTFTNCPGWREFLTNAYVDQSTLSQIEQAKEFSLSNQYDRFEFWTCFCRLSQKQLYELTYAIVMVHGAVLGATAVSCHQFTKRQNARHVAEFLVRLPKDSKQEFEDVSGIKLKKPTQVTVK